MLRWASVVAVAALRQVRRVGQVAGGRLGQLEDLLAEVAQLDVRVRSVERDQARPASAGCRPRPRGQVGVDVVLELDQQRRELGVADLVLVRQVDSSTTVAPSRRQLAATPRSITRVDLRRRLRAGPRHTPIRLPRSASGSRPRVVHAERGRRRERWPGRAGRRRRITDSVIAASTTWRAIGPGGVLLGRDRHDAGPADQAERRLDADHAVRAGRADDRAVGLGADRHRGQVGGDRRRRAATTSRTGCGPARTGCWSGRRRRSSRWSSWCDRKLAHSDRLALPRITAPAARSRRDQVGVPGRRDRSQRQRAGRGRLPVRGCRCCP